MYLFFGFRNTRFLYYLFISFLYHQISSDNIEIAFTVNNINIFELDSFYIIEQIKFQKISDDPFDYLLGIFEGSNYTTFSDALPIGMIKEAELSDSNSIEVNININVFLPYKYIRYNPPKSNKKYINNIKLFGHIYTDGEDLDGKTFFTATNLPLMIINTKNQVEPLSLEHYIDSRILIVSNNKLDLDLNQTASIRLRGHSTSGRPKKPYKIKFDKKQKILGISGKYKKWAILANHYDKSLIRNILAFKISEMIGLKFTPRCEPVDIIVNGNFRGNYFICDQVEVKEGRVDIEEISDNDISGRYLIEIDIRAMEEEKFFFDK